MKRKITSIIVLCLLFASLMILQISAVEPRSYFEGCADCGANVVAYCDGPSAGAYPATEELTHMYGGFLIFNRKECTYLRYNHDTTEYCTGDTIHKNPGDTVIAGEEGHTYDEEGKNVCGEEDFEPCRRNSVAYRSEI